LKTTLGQRAADWVTEFSGSWPFILWTTVVLIAWVTLNSSNAVSFDPYPFLLLNWALTVISTLQTPLVMMSNNRQNERDRENVAAIMAKIQAIQESLTNLQA